MSRALATLLLCLPLLAHAFELAGIVVGVADGDTLTVRDDAEQKHRRSRGQGKARGPVARGTGGALALPEGNARELTSAHARRLA